MIQTRIVPWADYQEFETVYQWLFSDRKIQLETTRKGIDRVSRRYEYKLNYQKKKAQELIFCVGTNMD